MAQPITDLTAFLVGGWRLDRTIAEPDGTPIGTVTGTARFVADAEGIDFEEHGELQLADHRGLVMRALRFHPTGPTSAAVHFDHGGFFHDVDLATGYWVADHPCAADRYRGVYEVIDHDRWRQRWDVEGPTKNHRIVTDFVRADDGGV